jgi:signal transduction histidine kinase
VDTLVTAATLAITVLTLATKTPDPGQRTGDAWAYLLAAGMSLPYLVHRRRPLTATAVTLGSLLAYSPPAYAAFPGFPVFALLIGVALHCDRRRSLVVLAASLVALSLALAVQPAGVATGSQWTSTILATAVCWLIGENQRNRRARWAAMEERALRLEREREEHARRAVAEERLRIARELHDVVAHAMSVIAVQSGMGHHVIDTDPAEAGRALAAIEETSRGSLVEMRRLLGVLREAGDAAVTLAPTPGLAELTQLVAHTRDGGVVATLDVTGDCSLVPPAVDLSAYRIVQEALTNVVRHGGTNAHVAVTCSTHDVSLEVLDDGSGSVPDGAERYVVTPGNGLIGMRERVAVFGGEFSATRRPVGGFRVTARLPWNEPR